MVSLYDLSRKVVTIPSTEEVARMVAHVNSHEETLLSFKIQEMTDRVSYGVPVLEFMCNKPTECRALSQELQKILGITASSSSAERGDLVLIEHRLTVRIAHTQLKTLIQHLEKIEASASLPITIKALRKFDKPRSKKARQPYFELVCTSEDDAKRLYKVLSSELGVQSPDGTFYAPDGLLFVAALPGVQVSAEYHDRLQTVLEGVALPSLEALLSAAAAPAAAAAASASPATAVPLTTEEQELAAILTAALKIGSTVRKGFVHEQSRNGQPEIALLLIPGVDADASSRLDRVLLETCKTNGIEWSGVPTPTGELSFFIEEAPLRALCRALHIEERMVDTIQYSQMTAAFAAAEEREKAVAAAAPAPSATVKAQLDATKAAAAAAAASAGPEEEDAARRSPEQPSTSPSMRSH